MSMSKTAVRRMVSHKVFWKKMFRLNPVIKCECCGNPIKEEEKTIDHILPKSKFPHLEFSCQNFAPMHRDCNMKKSDDLTPVKKIHNIYPVEWL